ncbi:MAG TPA: hypothetical protein VNA28_03770 [Solirubrobacteraceae bacterium]|nr:hypothetical protein [Solirubrobacteraceae bacterium]
MSPPYTRRVLSPRRNAVRCVVIASLAVVAPMLGAAQQAQAAEKAIWGPVTLSDGRSAFPLYRELGVDTLQLILNWRDVAQVRPGDATDPADPAYAWPQEIATAIAEGDRHGVRIALRVYDTPGWANGGGPAMRTPDDPGDYADFLTAATRRYPAVRRWMIWTEPNRNDRFLPNNADGRDGPRAYARLLDRAYVALKAGNPRNIVIGGNTWTSGTVKPPDFLRFMRLPDGRTPRLDWFGHNPFPFRFPSLRGAPLAGGFRDISDLDTLSGEVRAAYGRRVPLWLSEYTIQSNIGSNIFATFVSRPDQARYLTAGYAIGDELGASVAGMGWLALLDEAPAPGAAHWGLLTYALERKPAFAAMARAPSERLRPAVGVARAVTRSSVRRGRLAVAVTPKASGAITVELRAGAVVRARVRATGTAGRRRTLRLRGAIRRGRYTLRVRSARAASVTRTIIVR